MPDARAWVVADTDVAEHLSRGGPGTAHKWQTAVEVVGRLARR